MSKLSKKTISNSLYLTSTFSHCEEMVKNIIIHVCFRSILMNKFIHQNVYIFIQCSEWKDTYFNILNWHLLMKLPFNVGLTPLARHKPPNLLLNILFVSRVAVALFVISMPAACPSNILLPRKIGWLWVLINTPAWAFRKMSFSSRIPGNVYTLLWHLNIFFHLIYIYYILLFIILNSFH